MVSAERTTHSIDDPIAHLAAVLEQWHMKPSRDGRWLQRFCAALEEREPAAWARYQRVAALGVEMAILLDLSPRSCAAIRGAAFLSAIARAAPDSHFTRSKKADSRRVEDQLRKWRWLTACADVLDGLRPGYDDSQGLLRHGKWSPVESRLLALVEDFDELTAGRQGAPRVRIPEALRSLRAGSWRSHDPQFVELLWSERGQAACDKLLRLSTVPCESALGDLKADLHLLDRAHAGPALQVQRDTKADKKASDGPPELASAKGGAGSHDDVDRSKEMSLTDTKQTGNVGTSAAGAADTSVPAQIAAAIREMEDIRTAATRGLEALASVAPALEELSDLVFRLQASVQRVQDGGADPRPAHEVHGLQSVGLRVDSTGGALDAGEVVALLETVRDLRDLRVQDHGLSWAILQAETDPKADLALLEGKVAGLLARRLGGNDGDDTLKVTLVEAA